MRVVLIDDHRMFSASLRVALEFEGYSVLVPELGDLAGLIDELAAFRPDVALLDLDLGRFGSGEDVLHALVGVDARVLIVSGSADESVIGRCLHAGAWGWVPKSAPLEELLESVLRAAGRRRVQSRAERERYVDASMRRERAAREANEPFERLSQREAAVLSLLQEGKLVERIAKDLFVSELTVRSHVRAILTKLGVRGQLEAVAKATRAGCSPDTSSAVPASWLTFHRAT